MLHIEQDCAADGSLGDALKGAFFLFVYLLCFKLSLFDPVHLEVTFKC